MRLSKLIFLFCALVFMSKAGAQGFIEPIPYGGYLFLKEFVKKELIYPQAAFEAKREGKVTVNFVVTKKGEVSGLKVLGNVDSAFAQEAIRIIAKTIWIPGTYKMVQQDFEMQYVVEFDIKQYTKSHVQLHPDTSDWAASATIYDLAQCLQVPKAFHKDKSIDITKFVYSNLNYPSNAFTLNIQGTTKIWFVVEPSGNISNIQPIKHLGGGCSEEVIRVLKQVKFSPGTIDNKKVRVAYLLEIEFVLPK